MSSHFSTIKYYTFMYYLGWFFPNLINSCLIFNSWFVLVFSMNSKRLLKLIDFLSFIITAHCLSPSLTPVAILGMMRIIWTY